MSKLNTRQKAFAEAYTLLGSDTHGNAKQSAIKAGYKESRAEVTGSELVRNSNVSKYIKELNKKQFEKQLMTSEEVLARLAQTARGENLESDTVTLRIGTYVNDPNNKKKKRLVYNDEVQVVQRPPNVRDQNKALELLGKYHKLFTDKQEVEVTTPIFLENVPDDD